MFMSDEELTEAENIIERIIDVMPDKMHKATFEALLCSMAEAVVGWEEVPRYFEYMAAKSAMIIGDRIALANGETKH